MRRASRAIVALAIGLVVGALAVAAGGALTASADAEPSSLFVVPPLAPGDEGQYRSAEYVVRFRFVAEPWVAPDGLPQKTLVLFQQRSDPWDEGLRGPFPFKMWLSDGQVVAWKSLNETGGSGFAVGSGDNYDGLTADYNRYVTHYDASASPPCGLVHSLQGLPAARDAAMTSPGCPAPLHFAGAATGLAGFDDGVDAAAFAGDGVRIVLDPHFPVPSSIALEGRVWNLQSFNRTGGEALTDALGPAHVIAYSNASVPDEANVEHPFPLSTALQDAADAEEGNALQTFLASHPGAYIAEAGFLEVIQDGRRESRWTVTASDGQDAMTARLSRFAPQGDASPRPDLGVPVLPMVPRTVVQEVPGPGREYPVLSGPPRLATLESLATRWLAVASNASREDGWNAWGFSVLCGSTCSEARTETWLGIERLRESHAAADTDAPGFYSVPIQETLAVDDAGLSLRRTNTDWWVQERAGPLVIEETAPHPEPATTVPGDGHAPPWAFPPVQTAAGLTVLGVLSALGYYLWPTLKSGLLSLLRTAPPPPENAIRASVREAIGAAPGIHFHELRRRTQKAAGTLRHHLRVLEDRGEILVHDQAGYTCYFLARGTDRHLVASAGALKAPSARRMLHGIVEAGSLSMGEAAALAGLTPSTATHHAVRLEQAGLVTRVRAGRHIELRPTPAASATLALGGLQEQPTAAGAG